MASHSVFADRDDFEHWYRRLKEVERDQDYHDLHYDDRRDIRDRIAERLGGHYSGRTLDRYEQILEMPRSVQDAVIGKDLPLTLALKIARLNRVQQQEIADHIEAGEQAKEVVKKYVGPRPTAESNSDRTTPHAVYRRLVDCLHEGLEILPQQVECVAGVIQETESLVDVLERSQVLLAGLREAEIAHRRE